MKKFKVIFVLGYPDAEKVAKAVELKFNVFVEIEKSPIRGYTLYTDSNGRSEEDMGHIKGYAEAVFDGLFE